MGYTHIGLFICDALSWLKWSGKAILSKLDQLSIYLLIAGTYTPFTLVTLRESVGWQVFSLIWGMALLGLFWT